MTGGCSWGEHTTVNHGIEAVSVCHAMALLDLDSVAGYLLGRGIVDSESIVDGDLEIARLSGRNQNFKVTGREREGLLVKQAPVDVGDVHGSVLREAQLYSVVATTPDFDAARPFIPDLLETDDSDGIMIARLLPDVRTLDEWNDFEPNAAHNPTFLFGHALAVVHSLFAKHLHDPRLRFLPRRPAPSLGGLVRPTAQLFAEASAANLQLLRIIQETPALANLVADVTCAWPIRTVIHGDLKSRNVLVHQGPGDALQIKIVDWELAGMGDPAWDVACVLCGFLERFVLSSVITTTMTADQIVAENEGALVTFRRNARAFWFAYRRFVRLPEDAASLLRRAVTLLAGVLLQSAYESVAYLPQLTPQAIYFVQIGGNIAGDADRATEELLGLDAG